MKIRVFVFILAFLVAACDGTTPHEKINNLNGYWEIKTVEPEEGQVTEFRFNEMIDYINVGQSKGYRKKMRPQLDGNYITSEGLEVFTVKIENDSINLYYETPYDSWQETLLSSKEDEIKMLNRNGTIYTYKRFKSYLIEDHGEEN